ncbi:hypothetical protein Taro_050785 [Colocasia esculenta]|uniref:Uncharacterized protein n=1 Tax=Colocasia esculenta TaxID=4460 RepID=A0A843XEQ0_COLES|nr:hypothetical protein [Colocasia esculenta]
MHSRLRRALRMKTLLSSTSVCHDQRKKDSLAGRRVRILNFSRQVVPSGILIFDDNDNVVMGKKLGGEYYEFVYSDLSWSKENAS